MLRLGASLLAPLRPRVTDEIGSPQPTGTPTYASFGAPDESLNPDMAEYYARDARLEVMRRATESLKESSDSSERIQVSLKAIIEFRADPSRPSC
jgi:hypothetical protein